jgi:hypothetical protein
VIGVEPYGPQHCPLIAHHCPLTKKIFNYRVRFKAVSITIVFGT